MGTEGTAQVNQTPGLAADDLLRRLVLEGKRALALPEHVAGAAALQAWQGELRAALAGVLGLDHELAEGADLVRRGVPVSSVPFQVVASVPESGYTRYHLYYEGACGGTGAAYLLVPDDPPGASPIRRPGILCLHGHGGNHGKALVAGVPPDADAAGYAASVSYDYAVRFARLGYVTLAPDALGFGERAADKSGGYHTATGLVAEYVGLSLVGLRLLDDSRALSVLAAQPQVDPDRLGVIGLSEGGKRTLFLAATDQRVRVATDCGYFTSLVEEVRHWRRLYGWDLCNHLFGLLRVCDLPDVAALVAPRPLLIQNGRQDPLYGADAVEQGFETVRRAYAAAGAPEAGALDLFEGEHVFHAPPVERWLERYLR